MSKISSFALTACVLSYFISTQLYAKSESNDLQQSPTKSGDTSFIIGDKINVIGTRFIDASRALTSVDRLSAEAVQNSDVDYPWQIVGKLPGVMLTEFNQGTSSGKLSFRGFNGEGGVNAIKLLIDGVPSNTNDGNMPFIDMLFPLEVEAVEVIRSTTDPRYGLNNIAGNVSFATRTGGNYLEGKLSTGSFDMFQAEFVAGNEDNGFSQNYSVGYREKQGYREHAALQRRSLAGKWALEITNKTSLFASARYYEANAEEPGYLTKDIAYDTPRATNDYNKSDRDDREIGQYSLGINSNLSEHANVKVISWLKEYEDDRFVKYSKKAAQQNRFTKEKHYGASSTFTYTPKIENLNAFLIETGANIEKQDNLSKRFLSVERIATEQTRDQAYDLTVKGVYVQTMIEPSTWLRITPAYRLDWVAGNFTNKLNDSHADINDYGTIRQPKLSIAIMPTKNTTVFTNWGRTFQIGTNSGAYLIGSRKENLAPSINEGWEAGLKLNPITDLEARLTFWEQTATGEFKRKLNDPLGDFDNIGATDRKGIDLQVSWNVSSAFSIWSALAWQKATIDTPDPSLPELKGNDIDHVPERILTAGIEYQVTPDLLLSSTLRAQSDYYLTTQNDHEKYGDFTRLSFNANYRLNDTVELSAQIDNLTNNKYEYVWWDGSQTLHSPGQGRSLSASIKLKL